MTEAVRRILVDADEKGQSERPRGLKTKQALERVLSLRPKVEKILGVELTVDTRVQDASYLSKCPTWPS